MNLIHIKNGSVNKEFQINQVKYLLCKNNDDYPLYSTIRQFVSKEHSEYREENDVKAKILIDDHELSSKNNLFIEITDTYSFHEDQKLNSRSLMLKYLEIKLQLTDFFDTINTIDILFHTLSDEFNENSAFKVLFQTVGYKQLVKLLYPYYGEDYQKDEFDLSLTELLSFQIQLIEYIAKHNTKYDNIFVYGRLHNPKQCIVEQLNSLKECKTMIFTDYFNGAMQLNDICLIERDLIDLANREAFYRLFSMRSFRFFTIEEVQDMIMKYLNTCYTHTDNDIYQELERFSKK